MATVFDVAKYIIDKYGAMSAMKLQKLVFYSQAMALVWDECPIFDDDFQAWKNGPVCPILYNAHRGAFMLENSDFLEYTKPSIDRIASEHKETIDVVVSSLINIPAYKLSEMTHNEAPWKEAREGCKEDEPSQKIISKDSMCKYYAVHW